MPANLRIRPRMRMLLSSTVTRIELIGIIAWLFVLIVDSPSTINLGTAAISFSLLTIWHAHRAVAEFRTWRFLGILYVLVLTMGFSHIINNNSELHAFTLPLTAIIVISSAILFVTVYDYIISTFIVWILMWPIINNDFYKGLDIYLIIFCVASMSVGLTLSYTYLRNMRSVLLIESEFRTMAETDFLTSILNRRAFMNIFQNLITKEIPGYFIMLDIDSFKAKNDHYGHDVGDKIICAMANCLRSTVGSHTIGRIGGEEFGVLLLGDDDKLAHEYALRLLASVRSSVSPPHQYTCSAGIARFSKSSDLSAVLKCADINMYKAKNAGKDRAFQDGVCIE